MAIASRGHGGAAWPAATRISTGNTAAANIECPDSPLKSSGAQPHSQPMNATLLTVVRSAAVSTAATHAAVLPVLMRVAAGHAAPPWPRLAIAIGYALALLIAVSRVKTGAHSLADIVPGFALGALASAASMRFTHAPQAPTPAWLGGAFAAWLLVLPFNAPASRSHDWVTLLALQVSGRDVPYTRQQMRREHHLERLRQRSLLSAERGLPARQVQADPVVQGQVGSDGIR
jgi:PAP2 superfamily